MIDNKRIDETDSFNNTKETIVDYQHCYDSMDRLTEVSEYTKHQNGSVVSYSYDPIAQYEYDENSNIKTVSYDNGTEASYTYNFANLVTSMSNKKGNTVLSSYNYTYNFDGNQATKTDNTGRNVAYSYDKLGRLTSENVTGVADAEHTTYQYDFAGNRIQMSVNGNVNNTYTYDKNNRLLRENCIDTSTGQKKYTNYDYDKNGNMKRKSSATSDITDSNTAKLTILNKTDFTNNSNYTLEYYKYNVFNQLTDYSNNKGKKASYKYLPNGLRSSKTVGGVKTEQIWDNQNLLMEINSNGDIANLYQYGLDMIKNKKTNTYYNYDAHGDVVQLTDSNGTVTADYTYDAFGNQKLDTNVDNPFRYCGEYYDSETGLIYLRNRYYDASTGRFINEDPIKDGFNWYSYCNGNPVMFFDINGLDGELTPATRGFLYAIEKSIDGLKKDRYNNNSVGSGYSGELLMQKNAKSDANIAYYNNISYEARNTNNVSGITFDIMHINSAGDEKNLCWAYCESMILTYVWDKFFDFTVEDGQRNAIRIAKSVALERKDKIYDDTFMPSSEPYFCYSFTDIVNVLTEANMPIYAILVENANSDKGHSIVISGAYSFNGENYIQYNDPNKSSVRIAQVGNNNITIDDKIIKSLGVPKNVEITYNIDEKFEKL